MAMAVLTQGQQVDRPTELVPACFVGRGRELAVLAEALATPAAVVLLDGEEGIGKSRLLREFLGSPAGQALTRPLVATCPPMRQPHTLGPIVDAVRHALDSTAGLRLSPLAGTLRPLFPEWADELPVMPEPAGDATAARHRVFRALAELLDCLRVQLLAVEDVQWADDATLEFLLFLGARQPPPVRQLRLVISWRPEDVPVASLLWRLTSRTARSGAGRRISLGPLDVGETAQLMSSMVAGAEVPAEFARSVHERTEGVPLAVEESMRVMGERAGLAHRGGRWVYQRGAEIDVPPTIRDAVLERIERLGPDARQVLNAAAVLGEPATEGVLAAVAALDPVPAISGLAEGLRCGLLEDDGHGLTSFRHVLAAQAVYEALAAPHRRELHRRAGSALEGTSRQTPARLARHFRAAGDIPRWLAHAEQAADLAIVSGDESAAAQLLYDLLANAAPPAQAAVRLVRKMPFPSVSGQKRFTELAQILRTVLADSGLRAEERAQIRFQLGQVLVGMEEWAAGRAELELAIPHLVHDPAAAARAMMLLAWPRGTACRGSEHVRWLQRAAKLTASLGAADQLSFAVDRATALLQLGRPEGWAAAAGLPTQVPSAQSQRDITRHHLNIADAAMMWGRYDEAARGLAAAADLAGKYHYSRLGDQIQVTQFQLDWFTGSWPGLADRAGRLTAEDTAPVTRLTAVLISGLIHAALGDQAQAETELGLALAETRRCGAAEYSPGPAAALARLWLADGRAEDAARVTDAPMDLVTSKGVWIWATDLAPARTEALIAAGRVGEATALVTAFARGLRGRDASAPRSALTACRATVAAATGEQARAAGLFARAAVGWQSLPRPYDALLARELQARCLLADGSREPGLALLGEVLGGLDRLGAVGDAARVARGLRKLGVAVARPWRGGPRGYGDRLSPRELDVVRLVIAGRTNPQIAGALHRSRNTVATQLKSAMRKLDVSSRTALAMTAADTGILPGGGAARTSG